MSTLENNLVDPPELPEVDPFTRLQGGDQTALHELLKQHEGRINYHLHRHGLGADPLAKTQARVYAAQAFKSYSPEAGASINTWLDRNLMQLNRFRRQRATTMKVPEQMQADAMRIERAKMAFEEEWGREPELEELADMAGLSVKRLDHVRKGFRKVTGEEAIGGTQEGTHETDWIGEALDMVWDESGKKDRQIIEMKTGYGGKHQPMEPKDIAVNLGISPVELSRRSARIAAKLDELVEALEQ